MKTAETPDRAIRGLCRNGFIILLFDKNLSIFPAGFVPCYVVGRAWRKSVSEIDGSFVSEISIRAIIPIT